jgi:hypothetical protein
MSFGSTGARFFDVIQSFSKNETGNIELRVYDRDTGRRDRLIHLGWSRDSIVVVAGLYGLTLHSQIEYFRRFAFTNTSDEGLRVEAESSLSHGRRSREEVSWVVDNVYRPLRMRLEADVHSRGSYPDIEYDVTQHRQAENACP